MVFWNLGDSHEYCSVGFYNWKSTDFGACIPQLFIDQCQPLSINRRQGPTFFAASEHFPPDLAQCASFSSAPTIFNSISDVIAPPLDVDNGAHSLV